MSSDASFAIDSVRKRVRRWHVRGAMPKAPLGVSARAPADASIEEGDAIWFAPDARTPLDDVAALAASLPDPEATAGALVVVAPHRAPTGVFAKWFGGGESIPRAVRGSALLSRGYGSIAGGLDSASGLDLVWGVAHMPAATASSSGTHT